MPLVGLVEWTKAFQWRGPVSCRVLKFWKEVASNTGHAERTPQGQLRTLGECPSFTHLSSVWPCLNSCLLVSHRQQGWAAEKGFGRSHFLRSWHHNTSLICYPSPIKTHCCAPSILLSGVSQPSLSWSCFLIIEMFSWVIRNRLEGGRWWPWTIFCLSRRKLHSTWESNAMIAHTGDKGGLRLTQLQFNSVSTIRQLLLPPGRAMGEDVLMLTSIKGGVSVVQLLQAVWSAVRKGGCVEKSATTQLAKIIWSIWKRKIRKRWENQHEVKLELWIHDALD